MSATPRSPHEASSPLGARPLPPLAGPWSLLHSVPSGVPQCSQGEKLMCLGLCGSRELSQCSAFALGGRGQQSQATPLCCHFMSYGSRV